MADSWENWYSDILARQGNKSATVQHENFVSLEFERFRIVIDPKFKFTLNKTLHHITPKTYYLQFNNNFTPCKSWATFFLIHIPLKYLSECNKNHWFKEYHYCNLFYFSMYPPLLSSSIISQEWCVFKIVLIIDSVTF